MLVLLGILLAFWLLLQTPFFQQWLADSATARLSKMLGTRVVVKKASIGFLNRVTLEEIYIGDQQKDTLASIGLLQVNTSDWFLLTDSVELRYIRLKDVVVRLYRRDSVWKSQANPNGCLERENADWCRGKNADACQ
jgi:hypothetical protein